MTSYECAACKGRLKLACTGIPLGPPFSTGPYKGGWLCSDCWTLEQDAHPEWLADPESRKHVADQARKIRELRSGTDRKECTLLEQDGLSVFISRTGTLHLNVPPSPGCGPNEYDPDRFRKLLQAVKVASEQMPGWNPDVPVPAASAVA